MTYRQKILKAVYPAIMWFSKLTGKRAKMIENDNPAIISDNPIHNFRVKLNNGAELPLEQFRGKKILIVNTASNCGFTNQYDDLQRLSLDYKDKLVVIGFPANDFKEQEKGSDAEIAEFCRINFGVTFPLAVKSSVVKGPQQNPVFKWLSNKSENGWNDQQPTWNFSKYLVDEHGYLQRYFDPGISPMDRDILNAIE